MTPVSSWKPEVFQCLIVTLITYHSWKHNSCCNNISKPCHRHGADTLQSHCAENGEEKIIEVLSAHFYEQMGFSLLPQRLWGVPAPCSSRCWGRWRAEANLLSGTNTPTPSAAQGRNVFVRTILLESQSFLQPLTEPAAQQALTPHNVLSITDSAVGATQAKHPLTGRN